MFDIQTNPSRTGLPNDFSPEGSWENRRYALLTQTLSRDGPKRMAETNGKMGVCREKEKCS